MVPKDAGLSFPSAVWKNTDVGKGRGRGMWVKIGKEGLLEEGGSVVAGGLENNP